MKKIYILPEGPGHDSLLYAPSQPLYVVLDRNLALEVLTRKEHSLNSGFVS